MILTFSNLIEENIVYIVIIGGDGLFNLLKVGQRLQTRKGSYQF